MSSQRSKAREAGRLYRSTRAISAELLRSQVYRAWERSHLQGANPYAMKAEQLSRQETERLIEQNRDLMNVARPYFRMLSQAAGQERHAVMLGDRHAVLLGVLGDEQTVNGTEPFPTPGTLLSEGVAGANGIGTPLAELSYAEIVSAEHFIEGFHPFTCQGIPLYNAKQEIAGVLSISVRRPDIGQRLKEILLCASRGIEADLMIANLEQDVHKVLGQSPNEYHALEKLRQDLIQSIQAARLKLEVGSRMVASSQLDYAMQLVQQAEHLIQVFRRRAEFWRDLAGSDRGMLQPICLTEKLKDLVDLLKTELMIRKIEVIPDWHEPISVLADDKSLIRKLLRYFLVVLEQMPEGSSLRVKAEKSITDGLVHVSFLTSPTLQPLENSQAAIPVIFFPLALNVL